MFNKFIRMKELIDLAAGAKFEDGNFDAFEGRMTTEGWTPETIQSFLRNYKPEIDARIIEMKAFYEEWCALGLKLYRRSK